MKRVCLAILLAVACLGTVVVSAQAATFETNTQCLTCHDVTASAGAVSRVDFAVPGAVDYTRCAVCHKGNLPEIGHYHYGWGECSRCHDGEMESLIEHDANWGPYVSAAPYYFLTPTTNSSGTFASPMSVGAPPETLHSLHSGANWVETTIADPFCSNCHATAACTACHSSLVPHESHAVGRYPAVRVKQANGTGAPLADSTCVNPSCHALAFAGAAAFSEPSCAACHADKTDAHGYDTTDHVADDASVSGVACSACHSLDLDSEHGGSACGTCHPTPRDSLGAWDQGCVTGGCHAPASSAPMHAGADAGHAPSVASQECLECHTGSDLAGIHSEAVSVSGDTSCLVCHAGGGVPASKECASCHFAMDAHPVGSHSAPQSGACAESGCHDTEDVTTNHTDCRTCHANPEIPVLPSSSECVSCHTEDGPRPHYSVHGATPPLMQSGTPQYAFYTGSASGGLYTTACATCHASNLVDAHLGSAATLPQKDRSGTPLTCASCHASADPSVVLAIAGGATACDSCHTNPMTGGPGVHGPINPTHRSTFVESAAVPCSPCHSDNIVDEHNGGEAWPDAEGKLLTYCDVCHENYAGVRGQQVQSVIEDLNDTRCMACHEAGHPDLDGHRATTAESLECGECHADGGIAIDVRAVHAECGTCHDNPGRVADIASSSAECSACHSTEGADFHRGLPAAHAWSEMPGTCQSANCHPETSLPAAHEPFMDRFPEYDSSCELCHQNADPERIPAEASASCETCHSPIHPDMDHDAVLSGECLACHESGDALLLHAGAAEGPCDVCHANPERVPALPTSTECVNCHGGLTPVDPSHYVGAAHEAADGTESGLACSQCHSLDMKAEHAGHLTCVQCHELEVDGFTVAWDNSCTACHATRHAEVDVAHTGVAPAGNTCLGSYCHPYDSVDLRTVHTDAGCALNACHAAGSTPGAVECATCHPGYADGHKSAGPVAEPYDSCTGAGCHSVSTDIHGLTSHPSQCGSCHGLDKSLACICHDKGAIHGGVTHAATACGTCHPSGTSKSHGTITPKLTSSSSRSAWKGVCDDCHGWVHDRGSCAGCHSLSKLHSLDSRHIDSNGDCKACHAIPSSDLSDPCLNCHPKGAAFTPPVTEVTDPGAVAEPYSGCTNCHSVSMDVHRLSSHPKECVDCHAVPAEQACSCHTADVLHAVSNHASADCLKCHESGAPKPHTAIGTKITATSSRSTWQSVCDDCHGRVHDRGTCNNCHKTTMLHTLDSRHVDSNSDCFKCHTVPSADASWDCRACHKFSSSGSDGGSWGRGGW